MRRVKNTNFLAKYYICTILQMTLNLKGIYTDLTALLNKLIKQIVRKIILFEF